VINVEEWAEIRRLHRPEGMSIKGIVRQLGVARNTVREALRSDEAPKYERAARGSAVDAFEPAIRRLLAVTPDMPATVVAERIEWRRGITVLRERVAELRPAYQVPDAFGRTEMAVGIRQHFTRWASVLGPGHGSMTSHGSPFSDALEAIGVAGIVAVRRFGPLSVWSLASVLSGGRLLATRARP
jgi:hypothetical protein